MEPAVWEVWLANVEFEEKYDSKKRPVVVVDESRAVVVALECTSKPPKNYGDFVLDWQRIGLKYKTVVKSYKTLCLPRTRLIHKIGDLGLADITMIMDYQKSREIEKTPYIYTSGKSERSPKKKGCYIATSIYGSYDCPQVWVLRRYRDYSLSKTRCGRSFIKLYYTLSPVIVKWFGKTKLFNRFLKNRLDRFVGKLMAKGYNNASYYDIDDCYIKRY